MKYKRINVSVPQDIYDYIKKEELRPSWILQDEVTKHQETNIMVSADKLLDAGYLTLPQYRKIVAKFDKHVGDAREEETKHVLRRELSDLRGLRNKIDDEIDEREIALGLKKPSLEKK